MVQGFVGPLQLLLELLSTLPDLDPDLLLLLSRAQTPDRPLGDLGCLSVAINFIQQGRVEFPLGVERCRGLPDLSSDCAFLLLSFSWEWSTRCRDPMPLISRWRKSENGRLIFLTLVSCGLWDRGVVFSVVSIIGVGLVTAESSLEVIFFFVFFENGDEVVKAKVLVSVFTLGVIIENPISENVFEGTRLS
jgi:hypothetical protein